MKLVRQFSLFNRRCLKLYENFIGLGDMKTVIQLAKISQHQVNQRGNNSSQNYKTFFKLFQKMIEIERMNRNLAASKEYMSENFDYIDQEFEDSDFRKQKMLMKQFSSQAKAIEFSTHHQNRIQEYRKRILDSFIEHINDDLIHYSTPIQHKYYDQSDIKQYYKALINSFNKNCYRDSKSNFSNYPYSSEYQQIIQKHFSDFQHIQTKNLVESQTNRLLNDQSNVSIQLNDEFALVSSGFPHVMELFAQKKIDQTLRLIYRQQVTLYEQKKDHFDQKSLNEMVVICDQKNVMQELQEIDKRITNIFNEIKIDFQIQKVPGQNLSNNWSLQLEYKTKQGYHLCRLRISVQKMSLLFIWKNQSVIHCEIVDEMGFIEALGREYISIQ